jgi:hypothetical protein
VRVRCWTDYPILELGDIGGQIAPVREAIITGYDGDKYVTVLVGGVETEFKQCYAYPHSARCGEVKPVSSSQLLRKRRQDRSRAFKSSH